MDILLLIHQHLAERVSSRPDLQYVIRYHEDPVPNVHGSVTIINKHREIRFIIQNIDNNIMVNVDLVENYYPHCSPPDGVRFGICASDPEFFDKFDLWIQ